MDTESRLSTEGKFFLGLDYRSEETCDPSSRPCKQNAATWKPLTVTGGDDKSQRSTCTCGLDHIDPVLTFGREDSERSSRQA